jgi:hypothetical protein
MSEASAGFGANRRKGRGRLSSIEMLPEEAQEAVNWAATAIEERKLPLNEILAEFNRQLVGLGLEPVSKSAFSRYAVRQAILYRDMAEGRAMVGELADKLGLKGDKPIDVAFSEMLKISALALVRPGQVTEDSLLALARTVKVINEAEAIAAENERRKERDAKEKAEEQKKAEAVSSQARRAGVSEGTLTEINRLLGVG